MATPADVARTLNVTPMTVRRWCAAHAAYLSPGAQPGHKGTRTLTPRDVHVLQVVAELRSDGQTAAQVNAHLADLRFPDIEEDEQPIAQEAPGAQESTLLVPVALYAAERARWDEKERQYQQRIEELQRELGRMEGREPPGRRKRPAWWVKLFGA